MKAAFQELQTAIKNPQAIEAKLTAFETKTAEFVKAHGSATKPAPAQRRPGISPSGGGHGVDGRRHATGMSPSQWAAMEREEQRSRPDPVTGEVRHRVGQLPHRHERSLDEFRWEQRQRQKQNKAAVPTPAAESPLRALLQPSSTLPEGTALTEARAAQINAELNAKGGAAFEEIEQTVRSKFGDEAADKFRADARKAVERAEARKGGEAKSPISVNELSHREVYARYFDLQMQEARTDSHGRAAAAIALHDAAREPRLLGLLFDPKTPLTAADSIAANAGTNPYSGRRSEGMPPEKALDAALPKDAAKRAAAEKWLFEPGATEPAKATGTSKPSQPTPTKADETQDIPRPQPTKADETKDIPRPQPAKTDETQDIPRPQPAKADETQDTPRPKPTTTNDETTDTPRPQPVEEESSHAGSPRDGVTPTEQAKFDERWAPTTTDPVKVSQGHQAREELRAAYEELRATPGTERDTEYFRTKITQNIERVSEAFGPKAMDLPLAPGGKSVSQYYEQFNRELTQTKTAEADKPASPKYKNLLRVCNTTGFSRAAASTPEAAAPVNEFNPPAHPISAANRPDQEGNSKAAPPVKPVAEAAPPTKATPPASEPPPPVLSGKAAPATEQPAGTKKAPPAGPTATSAGLGASMNAGVAVQGGVRVAEGIKEGDAGAVVVGAAQIGSSTTAAIADATGALRVAKKAGTAGIVVGVGADAYEVYKMARAGEDPVVIVKKVEGMAANTAGNLVTFGMAGDAPRILTDAKIDTADELKKLMEEGARGELTAEQLSERLKKLGSKDLEALGDAVMATTPVKAATDAIEIGKTIGDIRRLNESMENDFKPQIHTKADPSVPSRSQDFPNLLSMSRKAMRRGMIDPDKLENPTELRQSLEALKEQTEKEIKSLKSQPGGNYLFRDSDKFAPLQSKIRDRELQLRIIESAKTELDEFQRRRDEEGYLERDPNVAAAVKAGEFASAREHYEAHGRAEGRGWTAEDQAYLDRNKDVADVIRAGGGPAEIKSARDHYERFGRAEGRGWTAEDQAYLDRNKDVANVIRADGGPAEIKSARDHYERFGRNDGRGWTAEDKAYLEQNKDVADVIRAGGGPKHITSARNHHERFGRKEGRQWGATTVGPTAQSDSPESGPKLTVLTRTEGRQSAVPNSELMSDAELDAAEYEMLQQASLKQESGPTPGKPESQVESTTPEPKVEPKPEIKVEPKPEPKTEPKGKAKPELKAETPVGSNPEPKPQPNAAQVADKPAVAVSAKTVGKDAQPVATAERTSARPAAQGQGVLGRLSALVSKITGASPPQRDARKPGAGKPHPIHALARAMADIRDEDGSIDGKEAADALRKAPTKDPQMAKVNRLAAARLEENSPEVVRLLDAKVTKPDGKEDTIAHMLESGSTRDKQMAVTIIATGLGNKAGLPDLAQHLNIEIELPKLQLDSAAVAAATRFQKEMALQQVASNSDNLTQRPEGKQSLPKGLVPNAETSIA